MLITDSHRLKKETLVCQEQLATDRTDPIKERADHRRTTASTQMPKPNALHQVKKKFRKIGSQKKHNAHKPMTQKQPKCTSCVRIDLCVTWG
ncbi:hypothetical protein FGIG_04187 [Fasciola gigantica]|uniref:Uncharacterized protein n=1 Tax=Fasciola gigantica TaxID=46835 RepID=A0A504YLK2_FASGI|nr:hypothetical protein FGIG_04187 [Fasciola gigantica]